MSTILKNGVEVFDVGTTWTRTLVIKNPDGTAVDLTGCSAVMRLRVKSNPLAADLATVAGVITGNVIDFELDEDDTALLLPGNRAVNYEITWSDGTTERMFIGNAAVRSGVDV